MAGDSPYEPIGARLRPPPLQVPTVARSALLDHLSDARRRLVLVSAPAGYGKTTLLRQWVARDRRPSAWVQLETLHNDPVALLSYIVDALAVIVPVDPSVRRLLGRRDAPIVERVLPGLAAAAEQAPPFNLVLDDAHVLRSGVCWRYVGLLLDALPQGGSLTIASRADPPLPLARLRALGSLAEIRLDDLRLTTDEAAELLRLHAKDAGASSVQLLLEQTEGWATGIYLAILAGDPAPDVLARGDLHEIADYLTDEVLERQPPDLQAFLLETSVLDQLCADLCRAITRRDDAARLLEVLARENLFVTPLDGRDGWFRYHHLFAQLLRAQLARRAAESVDDLHVRAAAWYEQAGDLERAVRHATAGGRGGDTRVAELGARACDELVCVGQFERARQLLTCFSDAQALRSAPLSLTAALLGQYMTDARVQRLGRQGLTMSVGDEPTPVGATSMRSWQAVLRSSRGLNGVTSMLEEAELACALESSHSDWLDTALAMRAVALYLRGCVRRSANLAEQRITALQLTDERLWWLGMRALIACDQDDWDLAESLDGVLQSPPPDWLMVPPVLAHAMVLGHRRDPGTSSYLAGTGRELHDRFHPSPWRGALGSLVFGEVSLHIGDQTTALGWAAEAEAILVHFPDAGVLPARAKRLRTALEELRLADPLTAAERRVLDLLPTQLTAEQMAARLFLTRNTVKSHRRSIYRKLGVTTRTDAVEQARILGLL